MKTKSLKLSREMEQALQERARARGVPDSVVMREAMAEYLAVEPKAARRARRSFASQASDLAGCVNGPADLSTHPRHMENFGR